VCPNEKHYLAAIQLCSLDRNNIHFKCTWSVRLYMLSFKRNRDRPREHNITSQLYSQRGFVFVRLSYAHSTLPARAIKIATNALLVYYRYYRVIFFYFTKLTISIIIILNVYLSKPFSLISFFCLWHNTFLIIYVDNGIVLRLCKNNFFFLVYLFLT